MINIQFTREDSTIVSVEISGHAESGPYGYDLVCAAVSALSIGTVNSLIQIGKLSLDVETTGEDGGYLRFALPKQLTEKQAVTADILLESLYLSLISTEEEYGKHVKVVTLT
ncbi:ribosomal-processing cysteine protease Prp [Alkalibacterium sp. MB6]|uniref:ribosomal-processing cysteine protease Prp n=1 Tax=Alkalibacterium sp. MB6 TaxID=2081965 RepID=UPI00137B89B1|nr:ribosomal-processing cysteine protease Prp [Alkalibacterium sp. MB6]